MYYGVFYIGYALESIRIVVDNEGIGLIKETVLMAGGRINKNIGVFVRFLVVSIDSIYRPCINILLLLEMTRRKFLVSQHSWIIWEHTFHTTSITGIKLYG